MTKSPKTTTAPTGSIAPFGLRMLPELKAKVESAARESGRSMNAEIVTRIEESFDSGADVASLKQKVLELEADLSAAQLKEAAYKTDALSSQLFILDMTQLIPEEELARYPQLLARVKGLETSKDKIMADMIENSMRMTSLIGDTWENKIKSGKIKVLPEGHQPPEEGQGHGMVEALQRSTALLRTLMANHVSSGVVAELLSRKSYMDLTEELKNKKASSDGSE